MSFTFKMRVLLLALVAAFTVGCGDSGEDFVVTGNNNNNVNPATTGTLVFGFTQAQTVAVPLGTETLDFVFFDADGDEVLSTDETFALTVTIENVPISAVEVEITARGAGGVPLAIVTDAVAVQGGTTVTVDLTNATVTPVDLVQITVNPNPVTLDVDDGPTSAQLAVTGVFSNGDVVPLDADTDALLTFNGTDGTVAGVSVSGLVTAVAGGATSVDVTADINGGTVTLPDVPINVGGLNELLGTLIVQPEQLVFDNQGLLGVIGGLGNQNFNSLGGFRAYFLAPGETDPDAAVEVTQFVGVSFGNFFPATVGADSFTYLYLDGNGIAVGVAPLGPTPAFGTTGTMTVTYIDPNSPTNHVYTDNVDLLVGNPELLSVLVVSGDVTLPNSVDDFPVAINAVYSNGLVIPSPLGGGSNAVGDSFELAVDANAFVTTDGATLDTTMTEGTATVEVFANNETDPRADFDVTVTDAVVQDVALAPAEILVNPAGKYTVTMIYSDGTTQDVTRIWQEVNYTSVDGSDVTVGSPLFGAEFGRLLGRDVGTGQLNIGTLLEATEFMTGSEPMVTGGLGFPPGNEDLQFANNMVNVTVEAIVTGISQILFP